MTKNRQETQPPSSAEERGFFWTPHIVAETFVDAYKKQGIVTHEEDAGLMGHGARIGSEVLLKSLSEHGVQIPGELLESEAFKATVAEKAMDAAAQTVQDISTKP